MARFTIDQLAQETATPVSTIRMYRGRKLLGPPEKVGRVGFFDEHHVERLQTITRLQEAGFSLAAIADLLDAHQTGRGLGAVLGLASTASQPIRLSLAELAAKFTGQTISQHAMQQAVALGLIRLEGLDVVIERSEFAEVGPELSRLGVSVDSVIDEYAQLQALTDSVANRFTALFETQVWTGADPAMIEALRMLGPLAKKMLQATFENSLKSAALAFAGRHREELEAAGVSPDQLADAFA